MAVASLPDAVMRQLVESRRAQPLLAGYGVGPMFHEGAWWYVPRGAAAGADYVLAGPELSVEFDRIRARIDRIDGFLAGSRPLR
jgi:hypothetical protein